MKRRVLQGRALAAAGAVDVDRVGGRADAAAGDHEVDVGALDVGVLVDAVQRAVEDRTSQRDQHHVVRQRRDATQAHVARDFADVDAQVAGRIDQPVAAARAVDLDEIGRSADAAAARREGDGIAEHPRGAAVVGGAAGGVEDRPGQRGQRDVAGHRLDAVDAEVADRFGQRDVAVRQRLDVAAAGDVGAGGEVDDLVGGQWREGLQRDVAAGLDVGEGVAAVERRRGGQVGEQPRVTRHHRYRRRVGAESLDDRDGRAAGFLGDVKIHRAGKHRRQWSRLLDGGLQQHVDAAAGAEGAQAVDGVGVVVLAQPAGQAELDVAAAGGGRHVGRTVDAAHQVDLQPLRRGADGGGCLQRRGVGAQRAVRQRGIDRLGFDDLSATDDAGAADRVVDQPGQADAADAVDGHLGGRDLVRDVEADGHFLSVEGDGGLRVGRGHGDAAK